jgi:hypothetical protein
MELRNVGEALPSERLIRVDPDQVARFADFRRRGVSRFFVFRQLFGPAFFRLRFAGLRLRLFVFKYFFRQAGLPNLSFLAIDPHIRQRVAAPCEF